MAESRAVYPNNYSSPETKGAVAAPGQQRNRQPYGTIRNVKFASNDPDYHKPTDEQFNAAYATKGIQPTDDKHNPSAIRNVDVSNYLDDRQESQIITESSINKINSNEPLLQTAGLKEARLRAFGVNSFVRSGGIYTWLVFQVPFAILNIVLFGIAAGMSAVSAANKVADGDALLNKGAKVIGNAVIDTVSKATDVVMDALSIDLSMLDPLNFWLITEIIMFAFGLVTLIGIYLTYKLSNFSPLGGQGSGSKIGAFILALVGYTIPLLNLFPWFYLWTMAVQRHPK
ncbi:MAG: hypothetical protein RLZZ230_241 [Candidatus Parcubacteria bacterium]|jgi:hypothetical protein